MKRLICAEDIELAKEQGQKIFYVDKDTIITPLAKDAARTYQIEFSTENQICQGNNPCELKASGLEKNIESEIDIDIIYKVFKTMMDKGLLKEILGVLSDKPYVYESDCSGFKLIRGNSVRFDVLDTGNANDKVSYQELISNKDSSISIGFLNIDHSNFNWELNCDEIYYVIEGNFTVKINDKTFAAHSGDVIYIPTGSKVVLGSSNKANLLYITF